MAGYSPRTKNNYGLFDVSSAFQKAIRRGEESRALYWGNELYFSGYHEYAWKRMMIMVSEDIGLAEQGLAQEMKALYDIHEFLKSKQTKAQKDEKQPASPVTFVHAVLLLVRARKSRLCDNAKIVYDHIVNNTEHLPEDMVVKPQIPPYAYCWHTSRGRSQGKGLRNWLTDGAKITNVGNVEGEQEYYDGAWKILEKWDKNNNISESIDKGSAFYDELPTKEDYDLKQK